MNVRNQQFDEHDSFTNTDSYHTNVSRNLIDDENLLKWRWWKMKRLKNDQFSQVIRQVVDLAEYK